MEKDKTAATYTGSMTGTPKGILLTNDGLNTMRIALTKRIAYPDIARTIAMLMVIWGHLVTDGRTCSFVAAFTIPAFFFFSGMMFRREKFPSCSAFLRHRWQTLLRPYLIYSFITWVWWLVSAWIFHENIDNIFSPLLQTFIAQGSWPYLRHNVPLWFVTCHLVTELLYYPISALSVKKRALFLIISAGIGLYMVHPHSFFDFTKLPWSLDSAFTAVVFYAIGHILSQSISLHELQDKIKCGNIALLFVSLFSYAVIFLIAPKNGYVSLGHDSIGDNVFLFYFLALLGTFGTFSLSLLFARMPKEKIISCLLRYFGCHSFDIMCIHVPLMLLLNRLTAFIFHTDAVTTRAMYRYEIVTYVLIVICCLLLLPLIDKIKNKTASFMCKIRDV